MSIDKKNLRELVIRPTLQEIGFWSESAEELLMLTFAQETHLGTYLRQGFRTLNDGRGVGRGIGSMEPNTFYWLQKVYPFWLGGRKANDLVWDMRLAVIASRLRYLVVPEKLPKATDIQGLAQYWDKWYNGNPSAGTWQEAMANYAEYVK